MSKYLDKNGEVVTATTMICVSYSDGSYTFVTPKVFDSLHTQIDEFKPPEFDGSSVRLTVEWCRKYLVPGSKSSAMFDRFELDVTNDFGYWLRFDNAVDDTCTLMVGHLGESSTVAELATIGDLTRAVHRYHIKPKFFNMQAVNESPESD